MSVIKESWENLNQDALINILLGQRLEPVEKYLQELGVNYKIEVTKPTRCLGDLGAYRIINAKRCGRECIQLTCVRESI